MSITDIIPDTHGQAEKLRLALQNLGFGGMEQHGCIPSPTDRSFSWGTSSIAALKMVSSSGLCAN